MRYSPFLIALAPIACSDSDTSGDEAAMTSGVDGPSSGSDPSTTSGGTTSPAESSSGDDVIYDIGTEDSGTYLLALVTPLDDALPLQFFATIVVEDGLCSRSAWIRAARPRRGSRSATCSSRRSIS
jgi:hypothetical protein